MQHERCYVYTPPNAEERPSKRQRTAMPSPHVHLPERLATYRDIWAQQEERIHVSFLIRYK